MTAPKPTPSRRASAANIVILIVIVLLAPVLGFGWFIWQTGELPQFGSDPVPAIPPPNTVETLTLPFVADATATSQNAYSGPVQLVLEGNGQIAGQGFFDALYHYSDDFGDLFPTPILLNEPLLIVDAQPVTDLADDDLRYAPFHVYPLTLNMGDEPRPLTATVQLPTDTETRGQFRVFIIGDDAP